MFQGMNGPQGNRNLFVTIRIRARQRASPRGSGGGQVGAAVAQVGAAVAPVGEHVWAPPAATVPAFPIRVRVR
jgi:hypothetical protein